MTRRSNEKLIEFRALITDVEGYIRKAFSANHAKKYGWVINSNIHNYTHGDKAFVKVNDNPQLEIRQIDEENIEVIGKDRYFLTRKEGDTNTKHPTFVGMCGEYLTTVQLGPMKAELRY